jgi:hypothetical protein
MWYTILILLALDVGGLLLVYALLRDRVRRATTAEAQVAEVRDEMSRLVVELNSTTDRNIALIEDRIASLNDLLAAADKKIGLLHREMEKHDVGTQVYSRLVEGRQGRVAPVAPPPRRLAGAEDDEGTRAPGAAERQLEAPGPRGREAPREAAASASAAPGGRARSREAPRATDRREPVAPPAPLAVELSEMPAEPRRGAESGSRGPGREAAAEGPDLGERVLMLHRAGFAAPLIASRVGAPVGEVELIISLEQRKGRA